MEYGAWLSSNDCCNQTCSLVPCIRMGIKFRADCHLTQPNAGRLHDPLKAETVDDIQTASVGCMWGSLAFKLCVLKTSCVCGGGALLTAAT